MTTLAFESLSRENQERRACVVGPHTVSLGLSLTTLTAVTCIVKTTLATVLELNIRLSHCRDRVTLWLQGLDTHSRESIRH